MQAACSRREGGDDCQCPDAAAARQPSPGESRDMLDGPCKCQMSLGAEALRELLDSHGSLCPCLLFAVCLVTPAGRSW